MNEFEVLGLTPGASEKEIKKAYFKAVREHPPDKDPEKFKEIRAAYETLSDSEKRANAEKLATLPLEIKKLLESAMEAMKREDMDTALPLLEAALVIIPDHMPTVEMIGVIHMSNCKFGLAVKHYEKYFAKFPGNMALSAGLAMSYFRRGWNKKAKAQFISTIRKGYYVSDFLDEFVDYCVTEREFKLLEDTFINVLERCSDSSLAETAALCLAVLCVNSIRLRDYRLVSDYNTEFVKSYLLRRPEYKNVDFFVSILTALNDEIDDNDEYQQARGLLNLAVELLPGLNIDFTFAKNRFSFELSNLSMDYINNNKNETGFIVLLKYIADVYKREFESRVTFNDSYKPEDTFKVFDSQLYLIDIYRKQRIGFRLLIENYPYIWSFIEEFVTKLQSASNLQKFSERHAITFFKTASPEVRKIMKERIPQDAYEYYEYHANVSAPVRSEKIPPNSPCPCGSGKKYKKCCGRNVKKT